MTQRKTRCDAGLPRCGPCERSAAACEYYDATKGTKISRNYVIFLQNKVRMLEDELARESAGECGHEPDPETLIRGAGLVRFKEGDESRFLGPSSGIAITRLVMELAKRNTESKRIKEIVPDTKAKQIKERFAQEDHPISKELPSYPVVSSVAAPVLPTRALTNGLVELFNSRSQYMLPTLHEPTFWQDVNDVYNDSTDAYQNFVMRMVLAISIQKLDPQYAGLADSYYLAALSYMEAVVRLMNLKTLQCFALIAQYSLLTPTRTAAYFIVGLAVKICQALGLSEESTITLSASRAPLDPLEIDMRRRLFWVITSMEFGLSHSLGRPSAFEISPENIDVGFFEPVDDTRITREKILPGLPSRKKQIAIHFFRMRLLQLEIRRMLYQRKREEPKDDSHPWFIEMEEKLERWRYANPTNDEGSGLSATWFTGRYNTIVVFLFRPSPQIPQPSIRAATRCYEASVYNIQMHRKQLDTRTVDISWVFTQGIFMALNTVLWSISYPEIRNLHPEREVENYCDIALESILLCSKRWPGAASAFELYENLVKACIKVYSGGGSSDSMSPSSKSSPASTHDLSNHSPATSPEATTSTASYSSDVRNSRASSSSAAWEQRPSLGSKYTSQRSNTSVRHQSQEVDPLSRLTPSHTGVGSSSDLLLMGSSNTSSFDPSSPFNALPSQFPPAPSEWDDTLPSSQLFDANANTFVGPVSFGLPANAQPCMSFSRSDRLGSLNQEQQSELMNTLEMDGLPDINSILDQSTTFFGGPVQR
ncbi:MAG: hypothetical protein M1819_000085 [Sarea resinae]|nr:MAG: hypothetical protein M1819_000085 [Sarea resinae]